MKEFHDHQKQIRDTIQRMEQLVKQLQKLEEEYLKQEEALYVISEFANDWEYWQNPDGTYNYVSPSCESVTGYAPEEFYSNKDLLQKIIREEDLHRWAEHSHLVRHDGAVEPIEFQIQDKSGNTRWIHHICRRVRGKNGAHLGIRGSNRDITRLKKLEEKLAHMAGHDVLTGLPNRSLFLEHLEQGIKEAERNKTTFVIVFIDLDGFKEINDHYGHKAGDQVLIRLAKTFTSILRKNDIVARFGGDEFVAFFEISDEKDTQIIREKITAMIPDTIHCTTYDITIRYSLGLSLYPHDGKDIDTLLKNADSAMYAQKIKNKAKHSR